MGLDWTEPGTRKLESTDILTWFIPVRPSLLFLFIHKHNLQTPSQPSNSFNNMAARVKETAKEEAIQVRQLAEDGIRSGAYIYPVKASIPCRTETACPASNSITGHLLLRLPPQPLVASSPQARPDSHLGRRCYYLHVPVHLRPASRHDVLHLRPTRCLLSRAAGPQRVQHSNNDPLQISPHRGQPDRHLRRHACRAWTL